MGIEVIAWLGANWFWIMIIMAVLTVLAKATKWKWDDRVIEIVKRILNFIMPGKKLYSFEEIQEKGAENIMKEEEEYRKKGVLGRLWEVAKSIFNKK